MVRIIKTFEELWAYQKEVRDRQHEVNPVTLEFIGNCTWAIPKEQGNNKRNTKKKPE